MLHKFREIVWNFLALLTLTHTTLAEFWSSTMLIFMGVLFLAPGQTIPQNTYLIALMPETSWGVLFFGIGACQSAANMLRASYARQFSAITATFIFATLASFGYLIRPAWPFAPAVFAASALTQGLVFVSLSLARVQKRLIDLHEATHADA